MIVQGPLALSDLLGDLVVWRRLEPVDDRLPRRAEIAVRLGLPVGLIPRKTEPEYAQVVAEIIEAAARMDGAKRRLRRLIVLGDTLHNDVAAFQNLCEVTGWRGLAFIVAEKPDAPDTFDKVAPNVYLASRWARLAEVAEVLGHAGFPIDEETGVVLDLDKTAIGARGRNDHVIDAARIEAVRRTVSSLLGAAYDDRTFLAAYNVLNQPEFHVFTADNQDYLAYVCLAIAAGLHTLEGVTEAVRAGTLSSFESFIEDVNVREHEWRSSPLAAVHVAVYESFRSGDPTPFKAFRHNEFHTTVERMGCLGEAPSVEDALAREIVLTYEVAQLALHWRDCGATIVGISDKPDEASLPDPDDVAAGYLPLHRTPTHCVGESIL